MRDDEFLENTAKGAKAHYVQSVTIQIETLREEASLEIRTLGCNPPYKLTFPIEMDWYADDGRNLVREIEEYLKLNLRAAFCLATRCLLEEALAIAADHSDRDFNKLCKSIEDAVSSDAMKRRNTFQMQLENGRKLNRTVIKQFKQRRCIAKKSLLIIFDTRRKKPELKITQKLVATEYFKRHDIWSVEGAAVQYNALLKSNGISFKGLLKAGKKWEEMTGDEQSNLFVPRKIINKKRARIEAKDV